MRFFEFKAPQYAALLESRDSAIDAINALHTADLLDTITDKLPEEEVGRLAKLNKFLGSAVAKATSMLAAYGITSAPAATPVAEPVAAPTAAPVPAPQAAPTEVDRVKQLAGVPAAAPTEQEPAPEDEEEEVIAEGELYKRAQSKYNFPEELAAAKESLAFLKQAIRDLAAYEPRDPKDAAKKDHDMSVLTKTLDNAMRMYKGFKAAVSDREIFKKQKEDADRFLQDVSAALTTLGNRVQGYSENLESLDTKGLKSAEKKKIVNAQAFTQTLRQALFGLIIEIGNKRADYDPIRIKQFLEACVAKEVIDMNAVVASDTGNIREALNPEWTEEFQLFYDQNIFNYSPGKTSAAIGPGEMALSMMGSPTQKADVGDLEIAGVKYEIKAGKSNGGRMNSKAISKAIDGWKVWTNAIEDMMHNPQGEPDQIAALKQVKFTNTDARGNPQVVNHTKFSANEVNKTASKEGGKVKYKLASKYNWNQKGFDRLQQDVFPYVSDEQKSDLFVKLFKSLVGNYDAVEKELKRLRMPAPEEYIRRALDGPQERLYTNMNKAMTAIAFTSYRLSEEHPWDAILFLNTSSLNYTIVRSAKELINAINTGDVVITGGFNFNDAQQTPTPGYNAPK